MIPFVVLSALQQVQQERQQMSDGTAIMKASCALEELEITHDEITARASGVLQSLLVSSSSSTCLTTLRLCHCVINGISFSSDKQHDDHHDDDDVQYQKSKHKNSNSCSLLQQMQLSFATALVCGSLQVLQLDHCHVTDALAMQLAALLLQQQEQNSNDDDVGTTKNCCLRQVSLVGNDITDVGAAAFSQVLAHPACQWQKLSLAHNRLTPAGIQAFFDGLPRYSCHNRNLVELDLYDPNVCLPTCVHQGIATFLRNGGGSNSSSTTTLTSLSVGCEKGDPSFPADDDDDYKVVEELRWLWQDAAYTNALDQWRLLLRLNQLGRGVILRTGCSSSYSRHIHGHDRHHSHHHVNAEHDDDNAPPPPRQMLLEERLAAIAQQEGPSGVFIILQDRPDLFFGGSRLCVYKMSI
jgi:Leucine Rich repeat